MEKDIDAPEEVSKKPVNKHGSGRRRPKLGTLVMIAFIAGALTFVGFRAVIAKSPYTHYHANFAVWINGQQDTFTGPGFYEEVTACSNRDHTDSHAAVHMHDNKGGVVHVHQPGTTWGSFFSNLGYTLGNNLLSDGTRVYVADQDGKTLHFTLNGKEVTEIADVVINSEDVLLIDYGTDSPDVIKQHYDAIPKDAHTYNVTADPAACSGGEKFDWKARLKTAIGIDHDAH